MYHLIAYDYLNTKTAASIRTKSIHIKYIMHFEDALLGSIGSVLCELKHQQ